MSKTKNADKAYRMGKQTGYRLIDGVYHIAPLYQGQFEELAHKDDSIKAMLRAVTTHAVEDLEVISKARKKLWDFLIDDLGLDSDVIWDYHNGKVTHRNKT